MTATVEVRIECDGCGVRFGPFCSPVSAGTGADRLVAETRARYTDPSYPRPWEHRVVDDESVDLCWTCRGKPWPPAKPKPKPKPKRRRRPAPPALFD